MPERVIYYDAVREKLAADVVVETAGTHEIVQRGGKGSGHHGHVGRLGEIGGSAPAGTPPPPEAVPEDIDIDRYTIIDESGKHEVEETDISDFWHKFPDGVLIRTKLLSAKFVARVVEQFQDVTGIKLPDTLTITDDPNVAKDIFRPILREIVSRNPRYVNTNIEEALEKLFNARTGQVGYFHQAEMIYIASESNKLQDPDLLNYVILHEIGHSVDRAIEDKNRRGIFYPSVVPKRYSEKMDDYYPVNKVDDEYAADLFASWVRNGEKYKIQRHPLFELEYDEEDKKNLAGLMATIGELGLVSRAKMEPENTVIVIVEFPDGTSEMLDAEEDVLGELPPNAHVFGEEYKKETVIRGVLRRVRDWLD